MRGGRLALLLGVRAVHLRCVEGRLDNAAFLPTHLQAGSFFVQVGEVLVWFDLQSEFCFAAGTPSPRPKDFFFHIIKFSSPAQPAPPPGRGS